MNEIVLPTSPLPVPPPCDVAIRPAAIDDVPFIDALQKMHSRMVGWMPTKQLEGKIGAGHVLVAEEVRGQKSEVSEDRVVGSPRLTSDLRPLTSVPVGYCIGHDQYFKRDDVGIIYQMNVVPARQRGFVGAALLKAMFDRAAYGCRLFCCWCAQDIEANRFWESMGFVPLAFRAGSERKSRVHIFWEKRIRQGDTTTPWWFPSQTSAGSIREDRLVLPIPPGTHWSDAKPIILPGAESSAAEPKRLRGAVARKPATPEKPKPSTITATSGLRFPCASDAASKAKPKDAPREPKRKKKNDPKYVAAARELRDRYLEHVNAATGLPGPTGKYHVSRWVESRPTPLLDAA
jgi:hypothetical protein